MMYPSTALAFRARVHPDTLYHILEKNVKTIDFDVADRLICVMGNPGIWREEPLKSLYLQVQLPEEAPPLPEREGKRRCARWGCVEEFIPKPRGPHQKYCSEACGQAAWRMKHGRQHTPSTDQRFVCRNGHERTPENTKITPGGGRVCRVCIRESDRRTDKRPKGLNQLKKCRGATRYKGLRPPRCNDGRGCGLCWATYIERLIDQLADVEAVAA